jgi:hypothetical protein
VAFTPTKAPWGAAGFLGDALRERCLLAAACSDFFRCGDALRERGGGLPEGVRGPT